MRDLVRRIPVRVADHSRLHRDIVRLTLGGLVAGLVLAALHAWLSKLGVAVALPVALVASAATRTIRARSLLVVAAVAAAAGFVGGVFHPVWLVPLAGAAAGALLARRIAPDALRVGLAALAGAVAVPLGEVVFYRLAPDLAWLFTPVIAGGPIVGLYAALAGTAAHVSFRRDPVRRAMRKAKKGLEGELLELAERGTLLYRRAVLPLEPLDDALTRPLRGRLETVAVRAIELAVRCQAIDRELGETTAVEIAAAAAEMAARADAATDPGAREQYRRAEKTLLAQADQVRRIRAGRDRVVAALHGQLALLERTRLSLLAVRSSDSSRLAGELDLATSVLEDVAREMEAESEAVLELSGTPEPAVV